MKYDVHSLPVGSLERARSQLRSGDLVKALRTCRLGGHDLALIQPALETCIAKLCSRKSYGVILSGYYNAGMIGQYPVPHLLKMMSQAGDVPSFLKQAYRFDAVEGLEKEIEEAIRWHETRGLPDAAAWRLKFSKLREQRTLRVAPPATRTLAVLEEVEDESRASSANTLELRPLVRDQTQKTRVTQEDPHDPYVISQTARVKLEQANSEHVRTLAALTNHLRGHGKQVSSSRLIDAFTVLATGPAIFEVKSISESNEREQVRHALSQLYEYRYLHQKSDATLWIVFSREPFSRWIIEYLTRDRDVRVIWFDDAGHTAGPSVQLLK